MAVGRVDLAADVAEALGIPKNRALEAVRAVVDAMSTRLANKEDITLTGFGSFKIKERAERNGRNPQTGEKIVIPASTRIAFKASK